MRYGDTGLRIYSEFSRRKITANVQYHRYFRILYLQDGMRNCTKSNMTRVDRDDATIALHCRDTDCAVHTNVTGTNLH